MDDLQNKQTKINSNKKLPKPNKINLGIIPKPERQERKESEQVQNILKSFSTKPADEMDANDLSWNRVYIVHPRLQDRQRASKSKRLQVLTYTMVSASNNWCLKI